MEPKKVFAIALMALLLSLVALDTASNITGFNISNFTGDNMTNIFTGNNVTNFFTTNNYTNNYTNTTVDNGSIQINESQVNSLQTDLNAKVNKSGDTMSGQLEIARATSASSLLLNRTDNNINNNSWSFEIVTPTGADAGTLVIKPILKNGNLVFTDKDYNVVFKIGNPALTINWGFTAGNILNLGDANWGIRAQTISNKDMLQLRYYDSDVGTTRGVQIFGTNSNTEKLFISSSGTVTINQLSGSGSVALCVDSTGKLFRSTNATSGYLTC